MTCRTSVRTVAGVASTDLSVVTHVVATTATTGGAVAGRAPRRSTRVADRDDSDARLVDRWVGGDVGAMAELYRRHSPALYAYALRIGGSADAADVVQDTMIRAAARIGQLRDPASLRPWLFAIARSQIYSSRRGRSARGQASEDIGLIADPAPGPADHAIRGDQQRMVGVAAAGLAPRDRRLLELCLLDGLTSAELAGAMGVDVEHLYVMIGRMRSRLSRSMAALLIARRRRRDCPELARISDPRTGFSPQVRKRIERHLIKCDGCRRLHGLAERHVLAGTSLAG
jgi:RNA polymerase sigma factor (sigma-70 family)